MKDRPEPLDDWLKRLADHNDQRAFRLLFDWFYPKLMRLALYYMRSLQAAEEIILDVFLKIWQVRHSLLAIVNFPAYLYTTTRNHCLNQLQKQKNSPPLLPPDEAAPLPTTARNPQQSLEQTELQVRIQAAIDALPPQCRLIFQLVKEQGFSYNEVAELLTISPRTVETQVGIAVRKLSVALRSLSESY